MREDYRLLTPENVELRFDVAGLGSRLAAALIDYLIIGIGYVAILVGTGALAEVASRVAPPPREIALWITGAAAALALAGGFFGWMGYFLLFELFSGGRSPGKRALGLRVVRADGQPLGFTAALVRNILRWIDQVALIGVFVMLIDASSRRLGDMAAGTLVIREPRTLRRDAFATVDLPEVSALRVQELPNAGRITVAEYTVIRDYFARMGGLDEAQAEALASRLASRLAQTLEIESTAIGDPRTFLATAARAFEARHQYGESMMSS
jgi:uncharacterized RDD family membrane protein YckC